MKFVMKLASYAVATLVFVSGCSPDPDVPLERTSGPPASESASGVDAGGLALTADYEDVVGGIPSRGRDPAVVVVEWGGDDYCSGTLIAPRLVLTSRQCVSRAVDFVQCPAVGVQILGDRAVDELRVRVGEDVASSREMARGQSVVTAGGVTVCDADIAVLVLDQPILAIKALALRSRGPAVSDRLRSVGFGPSDVTDSSGRKRVREHVRVSDVSFGEFVLTERSCADAPGGPAVDPETGEVVGVLSRRGATCASSTSGVYVRVDAFAWLTEEAFSVLARVEAEERAAKGGDPSIKAVKKGTKQRPASDVGGPCEHAGDCAAGICLSERVPDGSVRRYCSRPCGTGFRCPTRYRCKRVPGSESRGEACVQFA